MWELFGKTISRNCVGEIDYNSLWELFMGPTLRAICQNLIHSLNFYFRIQFSITFEFTSIVLSNSFSNSQVDATSKFVPKSLSVPLQCHFRVHFDFTSLSRSGSLRMHSRIITNSSWFHIRIHSDCTWICIDSVSPSLSNSLRCNCLPHFGILFDLTFEPTSRLHSVSTSMLYHDSFNIMNYSCMCNMIIALIHELLVHMLALFFWFFF